MFVEPQRWAASGADTSEVDIDPRLLCDERARVISEACAPDVCSTRLLPI